MYSILPENLFFVSHRLISGRLTPRSVLSECLIQDVPIWVLASIATTPENPPMGRGKMSTSPGPTVFHFWPKTPSIESQFMGNRVSVVWWKSMRAGLRFLGHSKEGCPHPWRQLEGSPLSETKKMVDRTKSDEPVDILKHINVSPSGEGCLPW